MSLSTCYFEYGRHLARLHHRRCAYTPMSNTTSHDNYEKINSWVSFCFLYGYMGLRLFGPPELHYKHTNECSKFSIQNALSIFIKSSKQPSHGKLKLANSCCQIQVGVCERHKNWRQTRLQTVGVKQKHVCRLFLCRSHTPT